MRKRKHSPVRLLKLLLACGFVLTVVWAAQLYRQEYREEKKNASLSEIHVDAGAGREHDPVYTGSKTDGAARQISAAYRELSGLNEDYLGWLKVYGTQIDLPVVLGADNEYYLNHDFYGEESSCGTLFADCLTQQEDETGMADGNLLIYGHHMRNGSMFGELTSFCEEDFFKKHSLVRWEGKYGVRYYRIFAALVIPGYEDAPDYFPIREYLDKPDEGEQSRLLKELRERAFIWRETSFREEERFLFLMTCDYTREDGRLLLCARCIAGE